MVTLCAVQDSQRHGASAEARWGSPALGLVNSEYWYGRGPAAREDQLESPEWLESYLEGWDLTPEQAPSDRDLRDLVALRALVRRLATELHERREIGSELELLRPYVERGAYQRRLVSHAESVGAEFAPVRRDWGWVLAEIAVSFVELLAGDGRKRIKLCANDECGWAFYDESKNRRRRWCDMQICGNVAKVRRFRARQQAR